MSPSEYVDALYRLCLGRPADAHGIDAWTPALVPGGDPTAVLAGLLASSEYRAGGDAPARRRPAARARRLLEARRARSRAHGAAGRAGHGGGGGCRALRGRVLSDLRGPASLRRHPPCAGRPRLRPDRLPESG